MGRRRRLHIGTSGWHYRHWQDSFYDGLPASQWLTCYARHFSSVEVNSSFYRDTPASTLQQWLAATPADFRFTLKGHRYISHVRRLRDCREAVVRERSQYRPLQDKLVAVVWQLPSAFHADAQRLPAFCADLQQWPQVRHVIEFRHDSWFTAETAACLQHYRVAVCQSDAADWPLWDAVTSDLVYIRLHGHSRTYDSSYSSRLLAQWSDKIRRYLSDGHDVMVYFDNDAAGAAPRDAMRLRARLQQDAERAVRIST